MTKLTELAFKTISKIEKNLKDEQKLNDQLRKGSYELRITLMDGWFLGDVLKMLDEILGGNLASWYLFERPKPVGTIKVKKKTYKIRNINDLKKYYESTI